MLVRDLCLEPNLGIRNSDKHIWINSVYFSILNLIHLLKTSLLFNIEDLQQQSEFDLGH